MCVICVYTVDTTCPRVELDGARYSGLAYKVEVGGVDGLVFFPLLLVFAKLVGNSSWRKIEQNKEAHTCFYHRIPYCFYPYISKVPEGQGSINPSQSV